jgi:hypothetical protein
VQVFLLGADRHCKERSCDAIVPMPRDGCFCAFAAGAAADESLRSQIRKPFWSPGVKSAESVSFCDGDAIAA